MGQQPVRSAGLEVTATTAPPDHVLYPPSCLSACFHDARFSQGLAMCEVTVGGRGALLCAMDHSKVLHLSLWCSDTALVLSHPPFLDGPSQSLLLLSSFRATLWITLWTSLFGWSALTGEHMLTSTQGSYELHTALTSAYHFCGRREPGLRMDMLSTGQDTPE